MRPALFRRAGEALLPCVLCQEVGGDKILQSGSRRLASSFGFGLNLLGENWDSAHACRHRAEIGRWQRHPFVLGGLLGR